MADVVADLPGIVTEVAARLAPLGIDCYFGRDRATRGRPLESPTVQVLSAELGDDFDTDPKGAAAVAVYTSTGPTGLVRWEGAEVRVQARAQAIEADGYADEIASKRVARAVVDAFLTEFDNVIDGAGVEWRNITGGFEPLDDKAATEIGARYQILFQIATPIDVVASLRAAANLTVGHGLVVRDGNGVDENAC